MSASTRPGSALAGTGVCGRWPGPNGSPLQSPAPAMPARHRHFPHPGLRNLPRAGLQRFADGRAVRAVALYPTGAFAAFPEAVVGIRAGGAAGGRFGFGMAPVDGEHVAPLLEFRKFSDSKIFFPKYILRYNASTTALPETAKFYKTGNLGVAVRVGFEPTDESPRQRFSRPPDSTALAPHRF